MHLVSCRHSTSGLAALMNRATRSMRSRTELMFQVVRERRIEDFVGWAKRPRPPWLHERRRKRAHHLRLSVPDRWARRKSAFAHPHMGRCESSLLIGWD